MSVLNEKRCNIYVNLSKLKRGAYFGFFYWVISIRVILSTVGCTL